MRHHHVTAAERQLSAKALRDLAHRDGRIIALMPQTTEGNIATVHMLQQRRADALRLAALIEAADQMDLWLDRPRPC